VEGDLEGLSAHRYREGHGLAHTHIRLDGVQKARGECEDLTGLRGEGLSTGCHLLEGEGCTSFSPDRLPVRPEEAPEYVPSRIPRGIKREDLHRETAYSLRIIRQDSEINLYLARVFAVAAEE